MLKRTDKAEGLTAAATATDPNTGSQTQLGWMPEPRLRLGRIVEPRLVVPQHNPQSAWAAVATASRQQGGIVRPFARSSSGVLRSSQPKELEAVH